MKVKTYTLEDLRKMPVNEVRALLREKESTVKGTAVVRGPDGKPKYDNENEAGQYGED